MAYRHDKDGHVKLWLANQSYKYGISNFHLLYCSSSDLGSTIMAYTDEVCFPTPWQCQSLSTEETAPYATNEHCLMHAWHVGASSIEAAHVQIPVVCIALLSALLCFLHCSAYLGLHVIVRRCRGCCCHYTESLQSRLRPCMHIVSEPTNHFVSRHASC